MYLIKEFQRLKEDETDKLKLEWNLQRTISKINYRIHTDAVKENLIPKEITVKQASFIYATEADLLNVALFGETAKEWRESNPGKKGNARDEATLEQLVVLSNLESMNSLLLQQKTGSEGAADTIEPDCHCTNEIADYKPEYEEAEGIWNLSFKKSYLDSGSFWDRKRS